VEAGAGGVETAGIRAGEGEDGEGDGGVLSGRFP